MSISPPSDIILDVARAADPVRYKEAASRLNRINGPKGAESFEDTLGKLPGAAAAAAARPPASSIATSALATSGSRDRTVSATRPAAEKAHEGFEAMALATFIESMMPEGAEAAFGSGNAGRIWKSMLAEQIAGEVSRSGGIGIAHKIAASLTGAVPSTTGNQDASMAASMLINTTQRDFLGVVRPDASQADDPKKT